MISLDNLSENDAYSLLFLLMSKMKDKEPYSSLSELSYILDKNSFLNFIAYYGGATIKVPTADEFHKAARVLVLYNSYVIQHIEWDLAIELAGYSKSEVASAKMELRHFQKLLEDRESHGRK